MSAALSLTQFMAVKVLDYMGLKQLSPVSSTRAGWWPLVREPFTGAWQRNAEPVTVDTALHHTTVFACVTLIANDIAKMRLRLVREEEPDVWREVREESPFWHVLRVPNRYQIPLEFFQQWLTSLLLHGNTYALKARDGRGVVNRLYVLDPTLVTVLQAPDGSVFYQLKRDDLVGIGDVEVTVPAREIIHHRYVAPFHPLMGVSPLMAAALPILQSTNIVTNSSTFFANGAQPGGILTAPGHIPQDVAERIKDHFDTNFTGDNAGKVAVLGDGLDYKAVGVMSATDAQLIDQLKWGDERICSAFQVPAYMVGVGQQPPYHNVEPMYKRYFGQCLQVLTVAIEDLLDKGLELPKPLGTEFNKDDLFLMDTMSLIQTEREAVSAGIKAINESRVRLNLPAVEGGDQPFLQQQNWPVRELANRDLAPPPEPGGRALAPAPDPPPANKAVARPEDRTTERNALHWMTQQSMRDKAAARAA